MKRRQIAQKVADQLFVTERAIELALKEAANLVGILPEARLEANLSAVVGQPAFDGASGTIMLLTQARRSIIDTHHGLATVRDAVGMRHVSFGPVDKPDENPERPGVHLQVIEKTG